jgi:hypothetical protein
LVKIWLVKIIFKKLLKQKSSKSYKFNVSKKSTGLRSQFSTNHMISNMWERKIILQRAFIKLMSTYIFNVISHNSLASDRAHNVSQRIKFLISRYVTITHVWNAHTFIICRLLFRISFTLHIQAMCCGEKNKKLTLALRELLFRAEDVLSF